MIYIALSVLLAIIAANGSAKLLFFYFPFFAWLLWRKTSKETIVVAVILAIFFFSTIKLETSLPKELNTIQQVYWTNSVKVDGNQIRGMMKNAQGQKIYARYEIQHEKEKQFFMSTSLVGKSYITNGHWEEPMRKNHEYAFDMASYLQQNRAIGIYKITKLQEVESDMTLFKLINQQRFLIEKQIDTYFPKSIAAEAKALIIGDQQDVTVEQQQSYQKLGITHLFAISGLHIALLSLAFRQLLLRLHIRHEHVTLILLVVLPTYAIIAGGTPSVWRAVITVIVILLLKWLHIDFTLESAIAICFLIFVTIEPRMIYQVGFQLSFLATLSLIISSTYLAQLKHWFMNSLWVTICCQLLVSPLLLYHFYEISLSSFLMNIIFVPLFSYVILPINIFLLLFTALPELLFQPIVKIYSSCRQVLTNIIDLLQQIPYQMWNPGKPTNFLLLLLLLVIVAFFYAMETARFRKTAIICLLLYCFSLNELVARHSDLRITFISVGQGDSTVIELPNQRQVYLIDSGGVLRFQQQSWQQKRQNFEVGRQIVVPFLKGRGITHIDKFILTHADADHVEGADEILKQIRVGEIHITPGSSNEVVMDDVIRESERRKVPIKEKLAGEVWSSGQLTMQYVMPRDLSYEGNNDSIVSILNYRGYRFILPGDLEADGEFELLKYSPQLIENATILKAGHHGSKTSSTQQWLEKIKPKLVIYSTGVNNRYNHPSEVVTERVKALGIPSLNTAEVGTIQVRINDKLQLETSEKKYELSR